MTTLQVAIAEDKRRYVEAAARINQQENKMTPLQIAMVIAIAEDKRRCKLIKAQQTRMNKILKSLKWRTT